MLLLRRVSALARHTRAASTVVHNLLGACLAKNPTSVDEWRWHDPVDLQMVLPSAAADQLADPSEALREPADGQRWRALIRAPRRLLDPGVTLRVYGLPAAVELHLKVERVVGDWRQEGEIDGVEAEVQLATPGFTAPFPICGVGGEAGGSLGSLLASTDIRVM